MANQQTATEQSRQPQPEQGGALQRDPPSSQVMRRNPYPSFALGGPFALMDRFLDQFFGRDLFGRDMFSLMPFSQGAQNTFWPQIEIAQMGDKVEIRADLPGLTKQDVKVELRGQDLHISGERRSEEERTEGGVYRSERSYGSFNRTIRLPEGAKVETAQATFDNGVLKVQVEVPRVDESQTRSIEVREASERPESTARH